MPHHDSRIAPRTKPYSENATHSRTLRGGFSRKVRLASQRGFYGTKSICAHLGYFRIFARKFLMSSPPIYLTEITNHSSQFKSHLNSHNINPRHQMPTQVHPSNSHAQLESHTPYISVSDPYVIEHCLFMRPHASTLPIQHMSAYTAHYRA